VHSLPLRRAVDIISASVETIFARPIAESSASEDSLILHFLATTHRANPDAEVSGPELQQALGLDASTVQAQITDLACQGLVQWDPLLTNIWIRITDKGLAAVEDADSRPGPG
jgi:DNA-binding MarR family transcriptional regulator